MPEAPDSYIGELSMFGYTFAPRDWSFCSGALIAISQNSALFALLGTQFGGNGRTDFALPNMNTRAPMGSNYLGTSPGLATYNQGAMLGTQYHTVTLAEMPTHTHSAVYTSAGGIGASGTFTVKSGGANTDTPTSATYLSGNTAVMFGEGNGFGITDVEIEGLTVTNQPGSGTVALENAGGSQSMHLQSPVIAVGFGICMSGVFPSRN